MAACAGNRYALKESEVENMKRLGTWSTWLNCACTMADCNPRAGAFEVRVIADEGVADHVPEVRVLDLAEILGGVAA